MKLPFLITLGLTGIAFSQGPLTPPGAPGPTMKTLDQVQPGTPINSLPYIITAPGYYYLTASLTTGDYGIRISSNDVVLDLRGFTMSGSEGSASGILLSNLSTSVTVRNGTIRGFSHSLNMDRTVNCTVENITANSPAQNGIFVDGSAGLSEGNVIRNCSVKLAAASTGAGIFVYGSSISNASGNLITGCSVLTETGSSNRGISIEAGSGSCDGNIVENCTVRAATALYMNTAGTSGFSRGNIVRNSTLRGAVLLDAQGGNMIGNELTDLTINGLVTLSSNGGSLISTALRRSSVTNSSSGQPGISIVCGGTNAVGQRGTLLEDLDLSFPGSSVGAGIRADISSNSRLTGMSIRHCKITGFDRGIGLNTAGVAANCSGGTITGCDILSGASGIVFNGERWRIDGNHVIGSAQSPSTGIQSTGSFNAIHRNTTGGFVSDFLLNANDTYGPIVDASGALPDTGTGSHPLANFIVD